VVYLQVVAPETRRYFELRMKITVLVTTLASIYSTIAARISKDTAVNRSCRILDNLHQNGSALNSGGHPLGLA
jgi:hypothetical protein